MNFYQVPGDETSCMDVRMQREGLVAGSQPAVVRLVDYYQPGKFSNHITCFSLNDVVRSVHSHIDTCSCKKRKLTADENFVRHISKA